MSPFIRTPTWLAAGSLALLSLSCTTFKQPAAEAPHAVVVITYLGGELAPNGRIAFGYWPGVNACKGKKAGLKCKKGPKDLPIEGRDVTFRIPVDEEVTISPYGLIDSSYKNDGVTITTKQTYCFGDPFTVTAKAGDKYHFLYAYDPAQNACGTKRAEEVEATEEAAPAADETEAPAP